MKRMVLLMMVLALAFVTAAPALADKGMADSAPDLAPAPAAAFSVPPTFTFTGSKHVVNGVALRNKASGWIHLRGVPSGASVAAAYLYWNFSDNLASGPVSSVLFNGNLVTGTRVANNADPCWGLTGNHTYRGVVLNFVPSKLLNQDYEVAMVTPAPVNTGGGNPWVTLASNPNLEGAALIVVYKHPTLTVNAVVSIYDKLSGTAITTGGGSDAFTLTHPSVGLTGPGVFSMIGADGQRGSGHDNAASGEKTFFNGVQIAGPGGPAGSAPSTDWDGSAGWPMPQLWDVHTHRVSFTGTSSLVTYTTGTDCLVPVALVLQEGVND